jgi:VWFA-related protein
VRFRAGAWIVLGTAGLALVSQLPARADQEPPAATVQTQTPQTPRPVFRGGVQRVVVATTVRTKRGKPITDLKSEDFELIDAGKPRAITEVRSEPAPVSVALLVDLSGSMGVAERREASRAAATHMVSWLKPVHDQVGLFVFDKQLTEIAPLGPAPGNVLNQLQAFQPFGATSLFDAIAETGRRVAAGPGTRRAVVAFTDGMDNASHLTAEQVSALASSIDVPVYIVIIVSPLDRSEQGTVDDAKLDAVMQGRLADLAHWTGGEIFAALGPSKNSQAARQIVEELRQQYLIVFEPDTRPGWHPIDIRTRQKDLIVRARSGYVVQGRPEQQ